MTEHQEFLRDSEFPTCLMTNGRDFLLIRLDRDATAETWKAIYLGQMRYAGVLGVRNGKVDARYNTDCSALAVLPAALATFRKMIAPTENADDSAAWLEALHRLPDTRMEN